MSRSSGGAAIRPGRDMVRVASGNVMQPGDGFGTLLAATVVVFLGYGTVLLVLPRFLDRVLALTGAGDASLHTGLLTGTYAIALFAFAPMWGRASDRLGRRAVLLCGLAGFALAMLVFNMARDLTVAYGARALAGTFAAAVIPVALVQAAESGDALVRARRFAWLSAAATVGFLSGPMLAGWLAGISMAMPQAEMVLGGPVAWPFAVTAGLAVAVCGVAYRRLPDRPPPPNSAEGRRPARSAAPSSGVLLALTLVAMLGLGALEVGLSLQAGQVLGLDPFRVGLLFTVCSLVMLATQMLWSVRPLQRLPPNRLIGGAFLFLAAGVFGLPNAGNLQAAVAVVGLAGTGTGVLIPLLAYEVSLLSEGAQGRALGTQTALVSLGQAGGSAGAGLLFDSRALIGYWALAAVLLGAAAAGLGLCRGRGTRV